jgi:outer membrane receptor protein involved in Fe transport
MLTVATLSGAANLAHALDSESAVATDQLQEITVTATRQSTTVQTTPISISAFTGDQIAARGIPDIDSLISSVPAISARNTGGPGEVEFEIRGLNSQGGNSSMVGMYFGEIPLSTAMGSQLGKNSMNPGTYDLQRVEVLSGPQGTLYGSSSMGGTVRMIPNPAELNTFAASTQEVISGTTNGGSLNHQENGMINLPLGDTAALRVVGSFISNSGWVKRLVLADGAVPVDPGAFPAVSRPDNFYSAPLQSSLSGVNTTRMNSVRAQILWKPIEDLTIEPLALYQSIEQGAPPAVDVDGNPTYPRLPAVWGHYEIYDAPEPQTDSLSLGSLTATYHLPWFSLTSATGFWHRNFIDNNDDTEQVASAIGIPVYDAAQGGIGPNYSSRGPGNSEQDYTRQLSEEFRITSTQPGALQWVAGWFYQDLYSINEVSALAPQAAPIFGGTNLSINSVPQVLIQNAVYGNIAWRFLPQFEVAAGFRHYHYNLHATSSQMGAFTVNGAQGNDIPYNASTSIAASGTVPSFSLTYNIDADHMAYVRIGKGFRLGGNSGDVGPVAVEPASNTNPLFAAAVANECGLQAKLLLSAACDPNIFLKVPDTYGSDSLWSYEIGAKSSFFNRRLIANVAAYLEDWYHPQFATNLAGYGMTVNGGNARIKGIEAQLQGLLPAGFSASLNATYIDAKFVADSPITGFTSGTAIPDTPKFSASALLEWKRELSQNRALFASVEDSYTGAKTTLPFGVAATLLNINDVLVHLPSYNLVNFRLGLRGERDGGQHWAAAMFVNNLTNRHVLLDPQPQIALQTQAFERYILNQPLTAGLDVSFAF